MRELPNLVRALFDFLKINSNHFSKSRFKFANLGFEKGDRHNTGSLIAVLVGLDLPRRVKINVTKA